MKLPEFLLWGENRYREKPMLIILTVFLVIATVIMVFLRKNMEVLLLLGLCFSLMMQIVGVMIFIAKKGGISTSVMQLFYFTDGIVNVIRYFYITLGQLGFLVTLGRFLFPFFLIALAINYSMIRFIRQNTWIIKAAAILPVTTIILYYPTVYHGIVKPNENYQLYFAQASMMWIVIYLITAVVLLLKEYFSITMKLCKAQFRKIIFSLFSLTGLYLLYFRQDPGQIYRFYSSPFAWNKGVGYLQGSPTILSYTALILVSTVCCILGFYSLFSFTGDNFAESRDEAAIRRKFDTAKIGASMFVHSMKNQILSNKVIYKRISAVFEEEPTDGEKLKEYIGALETSNTNMLRRVEELYRFVKTNEIYMVPVYLEEIISSAVEKFKEKHGEAEVEIEYREKIQVLADKTHFCEALSNIISNGYEAMIEANTHKTKKMLIKCYNERLYSVIEIRDFGTGMSQSVRKRVFEPFFSSKNSNHNWGMGLYYVREIVKGHLGMINIESTEGEGSSFFVMLPRY